MATGEGGMSFGDLMKSYEAHQASGEADNGLLGGTRTSGAGAFSFQGYSFQGYSLQETMNGFGSTISSGFQSIGTSQYVKGTPLEGFARSGDAAGDVEAGEGVASSVSTSAESSFASLSRSERFKGFVILLLLSAFFFSLALFFLGVAILFPAKFAFPFSMGSISFMGAFALIKGPTAWLQSVCSRSQLPFTLAYFLSIIGTIMACVVWRSYIWVILFSGIQLCALGYYAFGNLPGGQYGLRLIGSFVKQLFKNVCWPCAKGCVSLFRSMMS